MSRDTLVSLIDPDPEQPRKVFDEAHLQELAQSMAANGLAVPILLRPTPDGRFIIVHGERRWRAAQRLRWDTIPAEVRDLSPDEAHWLSLIENVQRADLSPVEEARAYQERLAQGLTQDRLAQRVGKDRSYIAQKLRLLTLPAPIIEALERRALREGHARQLLKLRQWLGEGWEHPAWLWAMRAELEPWSVAQLAQEMDGWYEELCYAVCYADLRWRTTGQYRAPSFDEEPEEAKLYWTMWGLLRSAGLLTMARRGSIPERWRRNAYARVGHAGEAPASGVAGDSGGAGPDAGCGR